jgi:hypothetical protein
MESKLINFFKKNWLVLLTFLLISGGIMICLIPDITWINTDCDGPHYIFSSKYLYPAHKSSAPLYLLLGWLALKLPFGTEAWRMALISGLSGIIASVFVYKTVRLYSSEHKYGKLIGCISALVYGGSALALSQNIIVESYPLLTMFVIGAFYFILKKRLVIASLFIGASCAIHPLALLSVIPMLIVFREIRNWKYLAIMGSFIVFYLYIPLTNRPPYMWHLPNDRGILGFIKDTLDTAKMLSGGLSIWDFPKRVLDMIGVFGLSIAVIGIIPLIYVFWKTRILKNILFWLVFLPVIYYISDLAPQTYVYMQTAIVFAAVLIGIGLMKMRGYWIPVMGLASLGMLIVNVNYFDVGVTLDKEMSARKFWNELDRVKDGEILMAQQGWEWAMVFPYNKDNDRNIIPICAGTLASEDYQKQVRDEYGIKFEIPENKEDLTLVGLQNEIIKSIVRENSDKVIWGTYPANPRTYEAAVMIVDEDDDWMYGNIPQGITDGTMNMKWQWRPDNPYDIITGAVEVEKWVFIVFSNYNVMMFGMLGVIGAVPVWIGWNLIVKKKRWSARKMIRIVKEV